MGEPGGAMGRQGPRVLLVDDEPRLRAQLGAVLADYGAAAYLVKGCRTSVLVEEITRAAGRHG